MDTYCRKHLAQKWSVDSEPVGSWQPSDRPAAVPKLRNKKSAVKPQNSFCWMTNEARLEKEEGSNRTWRRKKKPWKQTGTAAGSCEWHRNKREGSTLQPPQRQHLAFLPNCHFKGHKYNTMHDWHHLSCDKTLAACCMTFR